MRALAYVGPGQIQIAKVLILWECHYRPTIGIFANHAITIRTTAGDHIIWTEIVHSEIRITTHSATMPHTKDLAITILNFLLSVSLQASDTATQETGATFSFSGYDEGKTNPIPKSATKGKRFDPEYWDMNLSNPTSRLEMFNFFLQDYDLIGMTQEQIILMLGEGYSLPDGYKGNFRLLHYAIMSRGCDPDKVFGINLYLRHGRAVGWCFVQHDKCSPVFTDNVLIQIERDERTNQLQIGNALENNWPKVVLKHPAASRHTNGKNNKKLR